MRLVFQEQREEGKYLEEVCLKYVYIIFWTFFHEFKRVSLFSKNE